MVDQAETGARNQIVDVCGGWRRYQEVDAVKLVERCADGGHHSVVTRALALDCLLNSIHEHNDAAALPEQSPQHAERVAQGNVCEGCTQLIKIVPRQFCLNMAHAAARRINGA
jgi:hypothetical protein